MGVAVMGNLVMIVAVVESNDDGCCHDHQNVSSYEHEEQYNDWGGGFLAERGFYLNVCTGPRTT